MISSHNDFPPTPPTPPAGEGSAHDWLRLESSVGPARVSAGESSAALTALPGYEILGELGRGASGLSCKARHLRTKQLVVLKLLPEARPSAERLARLRAAAELRHPNIVPIVSAGEHAGRAYLSAEYVEGMTLTQWRARTPPSPHQAAALLEPLARAVQHAHDHGVTHGALRPDAILLGRPARPHDDLLAVEPRLTGFGLAAGEGAPEWINGAAPYAAPDPVAGAPADIYALGAILYDLLTGHPPFEGTSAAETALLARTLEPVAPRRLRPLVPPDLETVCLKCLEKEPRRRYSRAADLADDLANFVAGRPVHARRAGPLTRFARWRRQHRFAAGALAALVALAALGWALAIHFWLSAAR